MGRKTEKDKSDTECRMDWSEGEREDGKTSWHVNHGGPRKVLGSGRRGSSTVEGEGQ